MPDKSHLTPDIVLQQVAEALKRLTYGEVVIKVEAGRPVWVEVHEKTRVG